MKRTLFLIVAAIGAMALTAFVMGATSPTRHVTKASARIHQPPDAVYAALVDFGAWPSWNKMFTNARKSGERAGHPVWQMDASWGTLTSEVLDQSPPAANRPGTIRTRIADPNSPMQGIWSWQILPAENGSDVLLVDDGEIANPLFRFFVRFIVGYSATIKPAIQSLARKFGEDPTVTVSESSGS